MQSSFISLPGLLSIVCSLIVFQRGFSRDTFGSPSELVRISFVSRSVPTERDPKEIPIISKEIP